MRYTRTDAGRIEALKRGELAVPAWNASLEFLRDEWEVGDDPTVEDLEFAES